MYPSPTDGHSLHNPDFLTKDGKAVPLVLDVTAGGGSIPFEAARLGFRTIANELNPVACLILRATCEWPQQYGYPLLDDYRECAEAFQYRVAELLDVVSTQTKHRLTAPEGTAPIPNGIAASRNATTPTPANTRSLELKNHETVRAQRYDQTYLWARTVGCPNCLCEIPLSPNWRLDGQGTGMRVSVVTGPDSMPKVELRIVHQRQTCSDCKSSAKGCHLATLYPNHRISAGTVKGAIATCPNCGSTTPRDYLAQEAQAERMGHRLYCVIYRDSWRDLTKAGKPKKRETTCRVFAEPDERHFISDARAAYQLESKCDLNGTTTTPCPMRLYLKATKPQGTRYATVCPIGRKCSRTASNWHMVTACRRSVSAWTLTWAPDG